MGRNFTGIKMAENPQPDKKKDIKKIDVDFFDEYPILINMDDVEGVESFTVFMRPLKIKEIQILNRVTYLQEKDENSEQAKDILISLVVNTLNVSGSEIPVEATSGLISQMISFNFPKDKDDEDENKSNSKKDSLIDCFDFLIKNGHNYRDIMEYPIPLFNNFIITIAERLGIKQKPIDARVAFGKLGIPIKPRGNK